jgi:L-lactate dehydrogenase (cytochrome)
MSSRFVFFSFKLKALCIGADGVGLGRPFLYGMSAYGHRGVEKVIDLLKEEIEMNMRLLGARSIGELKQEHVITDGLKRHGVVRDYLAEGVYDRMAPIMPRSKL